MQPGWEHCTAAKLLGLAGPSHTEQENRYKHSTKVMGRKSMSCVIFMGVLDRASLNKDS